jgi:hypothetical protein
MEFATPQRSGKDALISAAEKKSMLDNLDLEGKEHLLAFTSLTADVTLTAQSTTGRNHFGQTWTT